MSAPATFGALINDTARRLAAVGIDTARLDARLLVGHVAKRDVAALLSHRDDTAPPEVAAALAPLVARRVRREPMAHILGEREFWSLPFRVTRDTLIPRPDTETLVQAAVDWRRRMSCLPDPQVLDLGTGTGCILLALLSEWPDANGVGVDISAGAISLARENARRLGFADRARFVVSDWADGLNERFDVIVCNPPYIAEAEHAGLEPEVANYEPRGALTAGADGLDAYRALSARIPRLMTPKAAVFLEIGWTQDAEVTALLERGGLAVVDRHRDIANRPRCLVAAGPS